MALPIADDTFFVRSTVRAFIEINNSGQNFAHMYVCMTSFENKDSQTVGIYNLIV